MTSIIVAVNAVLLKDVEDDLGVPTSAAVSAEPG